MEYFPEKPGLLAWGRRAVIGWALALLLGGGLAFAVSSQAKTKPKHHTQKSKSHTLKCRAGYVRRTVKVAKRKHGRIVRVHHKIVYVRVQRCVKVSKPKPKPKPPTTTTPGSPAPVVPPPSSSPPPKPPPPPPPVAPANTAVPQVSGSTRAGQTLSATPGTWTGTPTPSLTYQWQRCNVGGGSCSGVGTGSTYLLGANDLGRALRVSVTAANTAGSASAASALTTAILPASDPVAVAVGDIACFAGDKNPGDKCEQSLTAKVASAQNPTAVLPLGDNQYESGLFSEYMGVGAYNATWGPFNPIVHPVPGNHEYEMSSSAAGYFQYFGTNGVGAGSPGGYYSFNIGSWHIIALNSDCSDSGCADQMPGFTTTAQTNWLQSDLAADKSACTLAYWHHPLISAGDIGDSPNVMALWTTLYSAHADVVLGGHDHLYERYAQQDPLGNPTSNGIREFVVGTGGENLVALNGHPQTSLEKSDDQDFGVLALTLHAASYDWKYVTTNGAVIDSGTTACHGSSGAAVTASAARDIANADIARLERREPHLVFDARPLHASLTAAVRTGLPVAVHCSRGCDVKVTASLRRGSRLQRVASFYETESQLPKPYSQILLRLPAARLKGLSKATLVLRFAALDAANHHRTVTRMVTLNRR